MRFRHDLFAAGYFDKLDYINKIKNAKLDDASLKPATHLQPPQVDASEDSNTITVAAVIHEEPRHIDLPAPSTESPSPVKPLHQPKSNTPPKLESPNPKRKRVTWKPDDFLEIWCPIYNYQPSERKDHYYPGLFSLYKAGYVVQIRIGFHFWAKFFLQSCN